MTETRRSFFGKLLAALGFSTFAGKAVAQLMPPPKPLALPVPIGTTTLAPVNLSKPADQLHEALERSEGLFFNKTEGCYYYPSVPERPPKGDSRAMIVRFRGSKGFQLVPFDY